MNTHLSPALYVGRVMHARFRPFKHRFTYRIFSLWLDIDRIGETASKGWAFGYNRLGLLSFHDKDHGRMDGSPLRQWVEETLAAAGLELNGGSVWLLCFPRILGFVFNPISLYFCFDQDERLAAMIYEVHNTFGERHAYVVPVTPAPAGTTFDHIADKAFHVSPFIGMSARYHFSVAVPDERLVFTIRETVPEGPQLLASQWGVRKPLTTSSLLGAFFTHPLMTLKVVAGIHWEALWLWAKGARYYPFRAHQGAQTTLGRELAKEALPLKAAE